MLAVADVIFLSCEVQGHYEIKEKGVLRDFEELSS